MTGQKNGRQEVQEAASHPLSHAEFLELILQDERLVRQERQIARRVKAAMFRELKPLDHFDWSFNPSIQRKQIFDLATCRFIREARDVLLLGPPGVGKSFLVQAIAYMGMKQLAKRSGEFLFEIVMRRYELRSTVMTSNRPLEDWGKLLGDVPSASAILDRFLHHAEIISVTGKSYRLRHRGTENEDVAKDPDHSPDDAKPAISPPGSKKKKRSQGDGRNGENPSPPCQS